MAYMVGGYLIDSVFLGIRIGILKSGIWCKMWLFGKIETPCMY